MFSARKTKPRARDADTLLAEVRRIEGLLADLSSRLKDPECELVSVMRLSASQKELSAYLQGIRYALGENIPEPRVSLEEI